MYTSEQRPAASLRPHLVGVDPDRDPKGSCQAKVCQFNDTLVVDEKVLGLEVPVEDTTTVTEVYSLQDLIQVALNGTKTHKDENLPNESGSFAS